MPCSSELLLPPLLMQPEPAMADTVAGAADYRGRPASRAATGGWKSSGFVMGTFSISRFGILYTRRCDMRCVVDH